MLTDGASRFTASMLRDLEAGSRTEGEPILGDMLNRARALGVPTPILRIAVCHLQVHERRLALQQ
jgi:2-dehydropantoate 2-reductase